MSNNNGSAEKNDGMAGGDRLSDLPESVLLYILSMLPDGKEVVRTSVLSTRWRSLWMSVPTLAMGSKSKEESSCLKGLLHSLAHADNLEIGSWCIKVYSFLKNSSHLQTLVIDWYNPRSKIATSISYYG
ncbi:GTP-binding protein [Datura stramonium]|uniref:GTP-binding protein n=1 Tax=Datura stramonium TaxID=4076 RepID=A0ABS8T0V8_DATST|nr:GTP-binding protein [Datura stramonium]